MRTTETITTITCDICKAPCAESDNTIKVDLSKGDRDVGPSFIQGRFSVYIPYGTDIGDICRKCLIDALSRFVKEIQP